MSHDNRARSLSNIYHVIWRGNNKQQIFEEEVDYLAFLKLLIKHRESNNYKIHAYCMMGNHIHLLIEVGKDPLDKVMKSLGTSFVMWYNRKYERSGHLFQDRFRSEPVDSDAYYVKVYRYILQNPVKAGLSKNIFGYRWSSANMLDNLGEERIAGLKIRSYFNSTKEMFEYLSMGNDDECLEERSSEEERDIRVGQKIYELTGMNSVSEFQKLELEKRDEMINKMFKNKISIREIARRTGLSRYRVEQIIRYK